MLVHGIELGDEGKPTWIRFSMLRLMEHLLDPSGFQDRSLPTWARRFRSRRFYHDVSYFRTCFQKFNRAADHVGRCRVAIQRWTDREMRGDAKEVSVSDSDSDAWLAALTDLPIYLDLMLFYLRMQADAYAQLVPYLYENGGDIKRRSFRDQTVWFTRTRPHFDAEYALVLGENLGWFEALAGKKPSGLRDVLVHHGGTYQVGWTVPDEAAAFKLHASLLNSTGYVEEDLLSALQTITTGWCAFLDAAWHHFVKKLSGVLATMNVDEATKTRYAHCGGLELSHFWVYPRAAG